MGMFGRKSISDEKQRLLGLMANVDPTSDAYKCYNQELERLTRGEVNQNGWKSQLGLGIIQTVTSIAGTTAQIFGIMRHEDRGNLPKSAAYRYVEKPMLSDPTKIKSSSGK